MNGVEVVKPVGRGGLPVALAVLVAAAGLSAGPRGQDQPGEVHTLQHGGRERSYLLHVPDAAGEGAKPLVLAFHGGGGHAAGYRRSAGLDAVATRERFVVAYPNGTGPLANALLTFNAGNNCCGTASRQAVDDVGFAVAVVDDVARRVAIDRRRVYATGHSNGAIMAYRLAAERADVVAAIAPVAGAMSLDRFAPARPVPVLHIHSVDDPRALYEGGTGPPFPGTNSRVRHTAVADALAKWIAHNRCRAEGIVAETRRGRAGASDEVHTATLIVYTPCATGADVAHWRLTGAGHGWPGAAGQTREAIVGPGTSVVQAAEEVWRFVSRFRR